MRTFASRTMASRSADAVARDHIARRAASALLERLDDDRFRIASRALVLAIAVVFLGRALL